MPASTDWISLREAAAILGVHPATVRNWSDQGRLPVYRTNGGHRRYKRAEVELWAASAREQSRSDPQNTMRLALRQIRVRIAEGQLEEQGWYRKLDETARAQYRESGAALGRGLLSHFADGGESSTQAEALGYEYAARARVHGLSRLEAVQAFLFFKNALVEGMMGVFADAHLPSGEAWATLSQVTAFTDEILLALLAAYRTKQHTTEGP
jgi:excisionase family DNA binding protein